MLTEQDLRDRKIGTIIQPRDYGWEKKSRTYREEGVWRAFCNLRSSYRVCCTDETGYVNHHYANSISQMQIDTYLLRRSKGEAISLPMPYGHVPEVEASGDEDMYDLAAFGDKADADMDPVGDLTWIYNNIPILDVKPEDAPSPGAFAHLKFVQASDDNKVDFFTKVYPRIIPSKSQIESMDRFRDDGREHFELLDKLLAESKDGQGEVSPL